MMHETSSPEKEKASRRGGWLFLLAGFVGALIVGWIIFPMVLYSNQPQPASFNHALHLDPEKVDGIEGESPKEKCQACHVFYEDGTFGGIPKLSKCMECHDNPESPLGKSTEEKKFLEAYVAEGKEIPWHVYSRQPDCVYFSHIAHVKMGKIECSTCHGNHGETKILPAYEENRLTGYPRGIWGRRISGFYWDQKPSDRMKMDDCADCHRKMGHEENNACFVCHK